MSKLPTYLTSGASSRPHHSLLVRLNEARSSQEEERILSEEVTRCREVLKTTSSDSTIADTLVILSHCTILRSTPSTSPSTSSSSRSKEKGKSREQDKDQTEDEEEMILLAALKLAEGGKNIKQRKIGYMYLVERLSADHELNLMLINTIRKDLSSSHPSHILLALHTIVSLPSDDLAPAVVPLLVSKQLLKHKLPAIRQRTIQALAALHGHHDQPFPISLNKLERMLGREADLSVISVILKVIRQIVQAVPILIHEVDRDSLIQTILKCAERNEIKPHSHGQIVLDLLETLRAVLGTDPTESTNEQVSDWLINELTGITPRRWQGAFLLSSCQFANSVPQSKLSTVILSHISDLLQPSPSASSSATTITLPQPNDHVLALRCLESLPTSVWDDKLTEVDMGVIMEGVNSADDTIRRHTMRLLSRMTEELPSMILERYVQALRTSTDLSLPLNMPSSANTSIEEKTRIARLETAKRAMEVLEVRLDPHPTSLLRPKTEVETDSLKRYVEGLLVVLRALEGNDGMVWEDGARRTLDCLRILPKTTQDQFVPVLCTILSNSSSSNDADDFTETDDNREKDKGEDKEIVGNTILVILSAASCDYPPLTDDGKEQTIRFLSSALLLALPLVQELILGALISLLGHLATLSSATPPTILVSGSIKKLESRAETSKYLKKRYAQVLHVIENDLSSKVVENARSSSLSDILISINDTYIKNTKSQSQSQSRSRSRTSELERELASPPLTRSGSTLNSMSPSLSQSQLRYEAYDSPAHAHPRAISGRYRDTRAESESASDSDSG